MDWHDARNSHLSPDARVNGFDDAADMIIALAKRGKPE